MIKDLRKKYCLHHACLLALIYDYFGLTIALLLGSLHSFGGKDFFKNLSGSFILMRVSTGKVVVVCNPVLLFRLGQQYAVTFMLSLDGVIYRNSSGN